MLVKVYSNPFELSQLTMIILVQQHNFSLQYLSLNSCFHSTQNSVNFVFSLDLERSSSNFSIALLLHTGDDDNGQFTTQSIWTDLSDNDDGRLLLSTRVHK